MSFITVQELFSSGTFVIENTAYIKNIAIILKFSFYAKFLTVGERWTCSCIRRRCSYARTVGRWCRGMFDALQPEGCGFESTSRGYIRCLAAGGLRVQIYLKPPRRDPGQVLHSQLFMRFGVKLRFSVRAVVGSASE